jgi:hypothetical protein
MDQYCVTTAMGKRLIAKGIAVHPSIQRVLKRGTLVIIAGTTNGYVAEEILTTIGQVEGFSRMGFRRGMVTAPGASPEQFELPGDVIVHDGKRLDGKTIFDVVDELKAGDVVLKGANALDPFGQSAVLISHPKGGTILTALPAIIGRRVQLIVPVGIEKRVLEDVHSLAAMTQELDATGPRLLPLPGEVFTELTAIQLLSGAEATLIAAGGIYGAEGAGWLGISGTSEQLDYVSQLIQSVASEPLCMV